MPHCHKCILTNEHVLVLSSITVWGSTYYWVDCIRDKIILSHSIKAYLSLSLAQQRQDQIPSLAVWGKASRGGDCIRACACATLLTFTPGNSLTPPEKEMFYGVGEPWSPLWALLSVEFKTRSFQAIGRLPAKVPDYYVKPGITGKLGEEKLKIVSDTFNSSWRLMLISLTQTGAVAKSSAG